MALYDDFETDISFKYLEKIVKNLESPLCILGGWAVYFTVNEHFEKEWGRKYIGSKDIDLGFYIEKDLERDKLINTEFGRSITRLKELGFQPLGFRFFKDIKRETGEDLTLEQSRKTLLYNIFQIYVDPIVNNIHPSFKEIFGFKPIDEPLLSLVFQDEKNRTEIEEFNKLLWLPKPAILLATKINALPTRTKDEKLIKDICDIYALSWYSGEEFNQIKSEILAILPNFNNLNLRDLQSTEVLKKAGIGLGINAELIKTVLKGLLE